MAETSLFVEVVNTVMSIRSECSYEEVSVHSPIEFIHLRYNTLIATTSLYLQSRKKPVLQEIKFKHFKENHFS